MAEVKKENLVEVPIPRDFSAKKSKYLTLRLNGKKLKLERGKTHKIPVAYANMLKQKQAFQEQGENYKDANSV